MPTPSINTKLLGSTKYDGSV